MRPKYQVFVSSTFKDLRVEREAVSWSILKLDHIPVGMENFSASDGRGWETIARTIDDSDYYVLIIGAPTARSIRPWASAGPSASTTMP